MLGDKEESTALKSAAMALSLRNLSLKRFIGGPKKKTRKRGGEPRGTPVRQIE